MDVRPEGTPAATFAVRAWTALHGGTRRTVRFEPSFCSASALERRRGRLDDELRLKNSVLQFTRIVNIEHADMPTPSGQTRGLTSYSFTPLAWDRPSRPSATQRVTPIDNLRARGTCGA